MKNAYIKIALLALIFSASCNISENQNSIFAKSDPASKIYKNELARKIRANSSGLIYTINNYKEKNGLGLLRVNIHGTDFNATGTLLVNSWHKFEKFKQAKGIGYSGSELKGLKFTIKDHPDGAIFQYSDLEKIVD